MQPMFGVAASWSKSRTAWISCLIVGVGGGGFASTVPLAGLGEMTSIGTLLAFIIVCAGVWTLRIRRPELARPFRAPWMPVTSILGIVISFGMMLFLPLVTWIRLFVWLAVGMLIYFSYSRSHSKVQQGQSVLDQLAPGPVTSPGD